jgi:hypothetical protein
LTGAMSMVSTTCRRCATKGNVVRFFGHFSNPYISVIQVSDCNPPKREQLFLQTVLVMTMFSSPRAPRHSDAHKFMLSHVLEQTPSGSCYAFASMATLEARIRIKSNLTETPVLSTQYIVSCSNYSQGCEGGFPYLVAGKWGQDHGVVEEACLPYQGVDTPTCPPLQVYLVACVRANVCEMFIGGCPWRAVWS